MPINAQFQQTPDWLKPQGLNGFQEGLKAGSDVIQLQQDIQQNALVAKAREQQIQMTGLKMAQEFADRDLMIKAEANSMELQQSIARHLERGNVSEAQQAYVGMIAKYPYLLNSPRNKALGGALKIAEDADRERQKIEDNRLFRRDQLRSQELIAEQNNLTRQDIANTRALSVGTRSEGGVKGDQFRMVGRLHDKLAELEKDPLMNGSEIDKVKEEIASASSMFGSRILSKLTPEAREYHKIAMAAAERETDPIKRAKRVNEVNMQLPEDQRPAPLPIPEDPKSMSIIRELQRLKNQGVRKVEFDADGMPKESTSWIGGGMLIDKAIENFGKESQPAGSSASQPRLIMKSTDKRFTQP